MDETQAQLEWEARAGRLAGYAALLGAALLIAALGYRIAALPQGADNVREFLPQVNADNGAFLTSGILTGLGMLAFIPPLYYLYRVTRFRRHELPGVARYLIFIGPILFAICSVWFQLEQADVAEQFVAGTNKTDDHAEDLLRDATSAVAALSLAASICTGLGTIVTSLNAMRAGLLSRFMGTMGVILGGLFVLPLIASPIIQLFWLLALAALYLDKWPGGGRGPAWETGEEAPWPTAQERLGPPEQEADAELASESDRTTPPEAATQPNPRASRKRKKKSRR